MKRQDGHVITEETIAGFAEYLTENERSEATVQKYMHEIMCFQSYLNERGITKSNLLGYRQWLQNHHQATTVNGKLSAINHYLKFYGLSACIVKLLKIQRSAFIEEEKELLESEYQSLLEEAERQKQGRLYHLILTILFTILLLVSSAGFGWTLWKSRKENADFERLAELVSGSVDTAKKEEMELQRDPSDEETKFTRTRNYQELYDQNSDFVGWLCIEGAKVDYPVMHTPEDSQYYIYRDFYGKKTASGTPFMDGDCTIESDSIILYGHNMKNGTMFGTLDEYQNQNYWKAHPMIRFDTLEEDREYEIFAVFTTRLLYENEEGFR